MIIKTNYVKGQIIDKLVFSFLIKIYINFNDKFFLIKHGLYFEMLQSKQKKIFRFVLYEFI